MNIQKSSQPKIETTVGDTVLVWKAKQDFTRLRAVRKRVVEQQMSQCLFPPLSTEVNVSVNPYFFVQNYCKCSLVEKLLSLKIIIATQSFR